MADLFRCKFNFKTFKIYCTCKWYLNMIQNFNALQGTVPCANEQFVEVEVDSTNTLRFQVISADLLPALKTKNTK